MPTDSSSQRHPRFDGLQVTYIREVSSRDVADVVDDLAQDFFGISIRRETFRVAAGGIGVTEAAVAFVLASTAIGFLHELGKDAYRKTRELLWELYDKWKSPVTRTGRFEPMSIILGGSAAGVYFIFETNLSKEDFMKALQSVGPAADGLEEAPGEPFPWWFEFRFDSRTKAWRLVHEEVGGEPIHRQQPSG